MFQTPTPLLIAGFVIALLATLLVLSLLRRRAPQVRPADGPRAFHQLTEPGRDYVVIKAFTDFDGRERPVGERWTFKGYNFVPYDDGLTLLTEPGPGVRLQWRRETQGPIIDDLAAYIAPV